MEKHAVSVVEHSTGDEVLVTPRPDHVGISVRDEMGAWMTVSLGVEAARQVAAALEAAASQVTP